MEKAPLQNNMKKNSFLIKAVTTLLACLIIIPVLNSGTEKVAHAMTTESHNNHRFGDQHSHFYDIDAMAAVGTSAALIERYLMHALTSLRLIAASPATRSGIWPEIRPNLQTLCNAIPGAALFIQPDGGYYSVEKGYTGLNLSDRDYFAPLFDGHEIHGSLIYSRSTGKKSVLMAVPAFDNEEVTGAVALSIFLDDFQELVSNALNLPSNYLWYVLNEEGNTVLHPRTDFVFLSPAEQGSPSMVNAVETITSNDKGYTSYIFAGRNTHILFKKIPFNNWRMILGKVGERIEDEHMPEAIDMLAKLQNTINSKLKEMDINLDKTVDLFNGRIPPEHIVRNSFRRLYEANPYIVNCALVDNEGNILYAEPSEFQLTEGENIRDHESFFVMQKNKAPLLSSSYLAVEGFDAVSLQHPIIDETGAFHGSVNLLIRPGVMIEEIIAPLVAETFYEPWIMEPDGRIIFDKSFDGTGRMLFLDYRFEEMNDLLALGDKISDHQNGQSDYVFVDRESGESVVKMAVWDTITLHNRQWRLIVSYTPYD